MLCQVLRASGRVNRTKRGPRHLPLALPALAAACATLTVEPATLESVTVADYHAVRELPDRPPAPATLLYRMGPDDTPSLTPGPSLPAYLPGERPGSRPHRAILRIRFRSPANLSREAEALGAPVNTDVADCATGADLGGIRLTSVYWNGRKLPDRAATAAMDRAPKPLTYTLFLNLRLPAALVRGTPIDPIDLTRKPPDLCIEVSMKRRGGDRIRTAALIVPGARILQALRAAGAKPGSP